MQNKTVLFLVALIMTVAMTFTVSAYSVDLDSNNKDTQGILYTLNELSRTAVVGDTTNNYNNSTYAGLNGGVVVIPATVVKNSLVYDVVEIGYYAFKRCEKLLCITVPSSVKNIDNCAFFDCINLATVNFSEGLLSIGASAFAGCVSLENVVVPSTVEKIGYSAFYSCKKMSSFTIPEGILQINNRTFACNDLLKSVSIPKSVVSIDDSAFNGCSALRSVTLPEGLTKIGKSAFSGCTALESAYIYKNLNDIGLYSFWSCKKLTVFLQCEATDARNFMTSNGIPYSFKGDVDVNNLVDVKDVLLLIRHLANSEVIILSPTANNLADVYRDGIVNAKDAIRMKQYLASSTTINLD